MIRREMQKKKCTFFSLTIFFNRRFCARDAESFLGPKVELGSVPKGLNLKKMGIFLFFWKNASVEKKREGKKCAKLFFCISRLIMKSYIGTFLWPKKYFGNKRMCWKKTWGKKVCNFFLHFSPDHDARAIK